MDKGARNTDIWLREKRFLSDQKGPGYYNSKLQAHKDSFNFGVVPFGSTIDRFKIKGSAFEVGNLYAPGPGKYLNHTLDGGLANGNNRNARVKNSHRSSFTGVAVQKSPILVDEGSKIDEEINLSVTQRLPKFRVGGGAFLGSGSKKRISDEGVQVTLSDMQETAQSQVFGLYPDHHERKTLELTAENSTVRLGKNFGNQTTSRRNVLNHTQISQSKRSIFNDDHHQNNQVGPGKYNPNHTLTLKASPSIRFSKSQSKSSPTKVDPSESSPALVKKQIESYLKQVLAPALNIATSRSLLQQQPEVPNVEHQSYIFASHTQRTNFANSKTPGPGTYIAEQANPFRGSPNLFGKYSKRQTEMIFRDIKAPFVDQSSKVNPAPGQYFQVKVAPFQQRQGSIVEKSLSPNKNMPEGSKKLQRLILLHEDLPGPGHYDPAVGYPQISSSVQVPFTSTVPRFTETVVKEEELSIDKLRVVQQLEELSKFEKLRQRELRNRKLVQNPSSVFVSKTERQLPGSLSRREQKIKNQMDHLNLLMNVSNEVFRENLQHKQRQFEKAKQIGVSFNSSSPRFEGQNRIMRAMIKNSEFQMEPVVQDSLHLGPGSYNIRDRQGFKGNKRGTYPFISSECQDAAIQKQLSQNRDLPAEVSYLNQGSLIKKSFNACLPTRENNS